jgi:hypothetical protein
MRNKLFIIIPFLIFLLAFGQRLSAQVSVNATIDTSYMFIGDQTFLRLHATLPKGYRVDFPLMADTIINKVEILDIGKIDSQEVNGLLKLEQAYKITSFDSGWYKIPEMKFVVHQPDLQADTLYSAPVFFGVQTIKLDTTQRDAITDIKKPMEAPLLFKEVLPWILYGLLIAGIISLGIYFYFKFARKEPIFKAKEKPKEPAHTKALRELDELKEQKLWQRGLIKEYYSAITDILRTYIEDRFGIPAMEQTTDEILEAFRYRFEIDKEMKSELANLLMRADFVKFAKATTEANENEASIEFAFHFVIKTKPVEILRDEDVAKVENGSTIEAN